MLRRQEIHHLSLLHRSALGLKHAGGHGDHGAELVVLDQLPADRRVRLGRAEQHAVRHDAGAAPARFEHPQKQREEQQLRLFRVGDGLQIVVDALGVDGALKGRIGEADGVFVADLVLLGNAVAVVDLRRADGVQHEVHGGDAEHGAVGVVTRERGTAKCSHCSVVMLSS